MMKNLISASVISLAFIQGPYIYYYAYGFMAYILILPYLAIGILLSLVLFYMVVAKKGKNTKFHITSLILGVLLGIFSLFSENFFEKIDWYLRKSQREEIISRIKNGSIKYNVNKSTHHLRELQYTLISNGGNDIVISANLKNELTVTFFINRGFLDHYSAFVYTDNPIEIRQIEDRIYSTYKENNYKIIKNWYRLNY